MGLPGVYVDFDSPSFVCVLSLSRFAYVSSFKSGVIQVHSTICSDGNNFDMRKAFFIAILMLAIWLGLNAFK